MAAILFIVGAKKPGVTSDGASFLAGLLSARGTPAAGDLSGTLRGHAEDEERLFVRIELAEAELLELLAAMSEAGEFPASHADSFHRLREELEGALDRY